MASSPSLSSSMEDYLEAIYHISSEKQAARAKDISDRLKVNKSSVTGALRSLSEKGLVNYAPYDLITLTTEGEQVAKEVVRRHETLKDFFIKILLLDEKEAEEASCKIEHAISNKIIDRVISFVEFMEICPRGGREWLKGFRRHCENGDSTIQCANSIYHQRYGFVEGNGCGPTRQNYRNKGRQRNQQDLGGYRCVIRQYCRGRGAGSA